MKLQHIILFASALTFISCSSPSENKKKEVEIEITTEKTVLKTVNEEVIEISSDAYTFGTLTYSIGDETHTFEKAQKVSMKEMDNFFTLDMNFDTKSGVLFIIKSEDLANSSQFEIGEGMQKELAAINIGSLNKMLILESGTLIIEAYDIKNGLIKGSIEGKGRIGAVGEIAKIKVGENLSDVKIEFNIKAKTIHDHSKKNVASL